MEAILEVNNVSKHFGGFTALNGVNLHVQRGERLGLIGPNGSGKTTMINCISGALMGIAGAPMPMYLSYIEPTSTFNLSYSISALGMPIIGGTSHWLGPLIGAILLGTIQQVVTVTISSELNVLVVGVLLVLFVVLAPEGVLGLVKKWKQSSK